MTNIYALYKGDEFVTDGTAKEIANKMNVSISTIKFYASPTYKRRGAKDLTKRNRYELVVVNKNIKEKFRFKKDI